MDLFFHFPQLPFYPFISGKKKKGILPPPLKLPSLKFPVSLRKLLPHFPYSSIYPKKKKSQNVFKIFVKSDTYKYPIRIIKKKVTQNPTTWNHYR